MTAIAQLAIPTFTAGPQDDLATKDVYGIKDSGIINKIAAASGSSGASGFLANKTDVLNKLTGGKLPSLASKLPAIPTQASILSRLGTSLPSLAPLLGTALRTFSAGSSSGILKAITSNAPILASIAGITSKISGGSIPGLSTMSGLLSGITRGNPLGGSFSLTDPKGMINGISGTINSITKFGIKGAAGPIISSLLPAGNKSALSGIIRSTLPTLLKAGDRGSVGAMVGLLGPGLIKSYAPAVVNMITKNYAKSTPIAGIKQTSSFNLSTFADTKVLLAGANAGWNLLRRQTSGPVTNITAVKNASVDFKSMITKGAFSSNSLTDKLLLLGKNSLKTPSVTEQFKQVAFSNKVKLISSPRNLKT